MLTSKIDLCFGNSVDAINMPDHKAPIILAMDASLPVFVAFKHSALFKNMIIHCPPRISKVTSPATAGLVDLQQVELLRCPRLPMVAEMSTAPQETDQRCHE